MFHSEARVILKITNSGNDQLKSLSTRQDEKNKKIFKTQDSSMTNDTIIVMTEKNPESSFKSVSQPFTNALTNASVENTSNHINKKTKFENGGSVDMNDAVSIAINESTINEATKNINNLKRSLVEEEVKQKKCKEGHNRSFEGKNGSSTPTPYSDEDKSRSSELSSIESLRGDLKVPPLKIILLTTDANIGIKTNSKNGNRSHYTALPYVISSEESLSSNQHTSPKSLLKTHTVEEQKSSQTRVLRSSNRCESNSGRASNSIISPIVSEEQLTQTTSSTTVKVDAGFSNPLPVILSEQINSVSETTSGYMKQITSTTGTATTSVSAVTAQMSGIKLHPKCRKYEFSHTESEISDTSSVTNITPVETNPCSSMNEPDEITNCYKMFLSIRKQIDKCHKNLFPVQPKPPSGFNDYLMIKRNYLLASNSNNRVVRKQTLPPANLHEHLIKLFVEQEMERQKLRGQHTVEKEKLVLCVEQEILRVHGRAARELANQSLPFSVCTILKDQEVYNTNNIMTTEQEVEKDKQKRSSFNGSLFLAWLQEVDDKWEKIKESMLLRHHNEAESQHAVQKMDWGWKLKELHLCAYNSEPNIDVEHVPIVIVSDDFDLLPA